MATIIIPARLKSTRLERKLLLSETGMTVLEHTVRAAMKSELADKIIVAVDSHELTKSISHLLSDRVSVIQTSSEFSSGTQRVAYVASKLKDVDIVNWQADEPELNATHVDELFRALEHNAIATLATSASEEDMKSSDCVKVVIDQLNNAMYFSRSPIPWSPVYYKDLGLKHVGVYAFSRHFLKVKEDFYEWKSNYRSERLEQLVWLESGSRIHVIVKKIDAISINTADDYAKFVAKNVVP